MEVTIHYVDGCPHVGETYRLVAEILDASGCQGVLRTALVASLEEAKDLRFPGSPTVLVDGVDPFFDQTAPVGLACRLYGSGATRSGVPPREDLEQALTPSS